MQRSNSVNTMELHLPGHTLVTLIALLLISSVSLAQKDAQKVYNGNNFYYDSNFVQATAAYREALKLNSRNYKASFNLGNALYRTAEEIKKTKQGLIQGKQKVSPDSLANLVFEEAAQSFAVVANSVSDKDTLHRAWHNIGNCYLKKKDYDQAINAYKKALKFDPKDEATRYNLAYALKNRPPKQNKGGGQNQNQDQKQQQQQQPQISKDEAERLLKALMNAEKKSQDKRKQKQEDASKSDPEKDW